MDLELGKAYLRLRTIIGEEAFKTPYAPTPEQVWEVTENAARKLAERAALAPVDRASVLEERAAICAELGCIDKPGVPLRFVRDLRERLSRAHAREVELLRSWDDASLTERQELDRMRRGWGPSSPTERMRRRNDVSTCVQALSLALSDLSVGEDEDLPSEVQDRLDEAYTRVNKAYTDMIAVSMAIANDPQEWPDVKAAEERGAALSSPGAGWRTPEAPATEARALRDIAAERRRQIEVEGYTPERDDAHRFGALARAGAAFAISGAAGDFPHDDRLTFLLETIWPWGGSLKRKAARRDLVRAAALILAEIERLDRNGGPIHHQPTPAELEDAVYEAMLVREPAHASDCALHNAPALPVGPCDCLDPTTPATSHRRS